MATHPPFHPPSEQNVVQRASELDISSVSTLLTAAQLIRNTDAQLLETLAARALALAPAARAMPLVQIAHALVKLAHPSDATLQGIAVALLPQLDDLNTRSLLLILNSYRIAGHCSGHRLAVAALPIVVGRVQQGVVAPALLVQAAQIYSGALMQQQQQQQQQPPFVVEQNGGGDEGFSAGNSSSGSGSASSHSSSRADVDQLWSAINAAAIGQLADLQPERVSALLRAMGRHASPELQGAAAAAAVRSGQ